MAMCSNSIVMGTLAIALGVVGWVRACVRQEEDQGGAESSTRERERRGESKMGRTRAEPRQLMKRSSGQGVPVNPNRRGADG